MQERRDGVGVMKVNHDAACPKCGATDGRCMEEDGSFLLLGKIHQARLLAWHGVDCLACEKEKR